LKSLPVEAFFFGIVRVCRSLDFAN
jgi:hypothetical protein